jgi:hypothetical protein
MRLLAIVVPAIGALTSLISLYYVLRAINGRKHILDTVMSIMAIVVQITFIWIMLFESHTEIESLVTPIALATLAYMHISYISSRYMNTARTKLDLRMMREE